jgi:hypothetical protein
VWYCSLADLGQEGLGYFDDVEGKLTVIVVIWAGVDFTGRFAHSFDAD